MLLIDRMDFSWAWVVFEHLCVVKFHNFIVPFAPPEKRQLDPMNFKDTTASSCPRRTVKGGGGVAIKLDHK